MNLDLIEIILLFYIIERVSVERSRYKLTIDTNNQFISKGYWSIWFYHKGINENYWSRNGGVRLIYFKNYLLPKLK